MREIRREGCIVFKNVLQYRALKLYIPVNGNVVFSLIDIEFLWCLLH
jgi:hypothetical protein